MKRSFFLFASTAGILMVGCNSESTARITETLEDMGVALPEKQDNVAPSAVENRTDIQIPLTLTALKTQCAAENRPLTVQQKTNRNGMACHSGVCALFLPILMYDSLFPTSWYEAEVKQADGTVYQFKYDDDEAFLGGTVVGPNRSKTIALVQLPALGKKFVLEVATESDGKTQKTSIQSQIDLLSLYDRKLASVHSTDERSELIAEAVGTVGEESHPWFKKRLASGKEADQTVATVIDAVCSQRYRETPNCTGVIEVVSRQPHIGPESAIAGLAHSIEHDTKAPRTVQLANGYLQGVCKSLAGIEQWPELAEKIVPIVDESIVATCAHPSAQILIALAKKQTVPTATILSSVNDTIRDTFISVLNPGDKEQRLALLTLWGKNRKGLDARFSELMAALKTPTKMEMDALYTMFVTNIPPYENRRILDKRNRQAVQAGVLDAMTRGTENQPVSSTAATRHKSMPSTHRIEHAALLFAMGFKAFGREALAGYTGKRVHNIPTHFDDVYSQNSLILFGLSKGGCSSEQIQTALSSQQALVCE